jgi:hypothetical protein
MAGIRRRLNVFWGFRRNFKIRYFFFKNVRGSSHSVLLAFSQTYVKYDLKKNKIKL